MAVDIKQLEKNVCHEFEKLLEDLTTDIVEEVIEQIVNSPLKQLFQKYNEQLPVLKEQNMELENLNKNIKVATNNLSKDLYKLTGDVSKVVIEGQVLGQLEDLYEVHEKQINTLGQNTNKLDTYIKDLKDAEHHVVGLIENITSDVGKNLLKDHIMVKFEELYKRHESILPKVQMSQNLLLKSINDFSQAEKSFQNQMKSITQNITDEASNVIESRLQEMQKLLGVQIRSLEEQIKNLSEVVKDVQGIEETFNKAIKNTDIRFQDMEERLKDLNKNIDKQLSLIKKENREHFEALLTRFIYVGGAIIFVLLLILIY